MAATEPDMQTIFNEAITRDSDESRVKYLDDVCANHPEVRARVEALLRAHSQAGGFFGGQPAATAIQPLIESPGTQIGPYKLLQQIGEGGFGVVYMAEQSKPVRRKVALKIIKPGMDTKEVIARFEAERQALALMDHPNIAKVLDGGATETGRPYFVMELVKGIPITQFCDDNKLDARQRLKLFISVCRAIQHAHQKGVIHRDIKPSNVLITLHDGEPVPRVIDFGVAKAISQQLTEKTMFTAFGQMIGTPQYMSPEQAEMSGLDVDTRSDIYSLGVLLYELLIGSTPLDPRRLRETAFHELQRMIREDEPPKPSTRLSTLGNQSALIASNRGTSPDKLGNTIRGDLDWIVMRSLEKNRERRYDTANAFADDVRCFLNNETVEARPPSLAYRFRKFAQRNKAAIATSTAIAVALFIGLSTAVWQAVRATNALNKAVVAQHTAKAAAAQAEAEAERASEAEKLAISEAALAAEKEQTVSSVIDFLVREIIAKGNPYVQTNRDLTVRELLLEIANSSDTNYPDDPSAEASVRHYVGVICHRMGFTDEAQRQLSRALELRKKVFGDDHIDTARTQFALAYALLDFRLRYSPEQVKNENVKQRRALIDDAIRTFERERGAKDPETLNALALKAFGISYTTGSRVRAEEVYQELVARVPEGLPANPDDPLDLLGSVYILIHRDEIGHDPEVDQEIQKRYQLACQRLPTRHPQRAFWSQWRGTSLYLQGKIEESYPFQKEGYEIRREVLGMNNYMTFLSGRALAAVLARQGNMDESITLLEACLQHFPEHTAQALTLGILYLDRDEIGDRQKWLQTANGILDQYEHTDNFSATHNTLKLTLAAAPESAAEGEMQQRAIALARRFRADLKNRFGHDILDVKPMQTVQSYILQNGRLAIALAEFRARKPEDAKALFMKVEEGPLRMIRAIAFAAHAVIAADEGDLELASDLIEKAQHAADEAPVEELHNYQYFVWNRPYMFDLMLDEARNVSASVPQ